MLSQLSYTPSFLEVVGLGRLELPTSRLSGVRSNHLSYKPAVFKNRCMDSISRPFSRLYLYKPLLLFERR